MTTSSPAPAEARDLVVVTGASTGIGAASAHELARRGFHVLAGVRRTQDADAINAPGVEPVILDITRAEHVADLAARVDAKVGALRAVVNNAAVQTNAPVETLPLPEWRRMFEVNLFGHVAVTQALLPTLLRHAGRVVNISSVGGKVAMGAYGPYAKRSATRCAGNCRRWACRWSSSNPARSTPPWPNEASPPRITSPTP